MTAGPAPVFSFRRHVRADGSPFLVAVVDEELELQPGDELHVRRVADPGADVEFVLQVVPARVSLSGRQLERARQDRLDGSALRIDPRDRHAGEGKKGT